MRKLLFVLSFVGLLAGCVVAYRVGHYAASAAAGV